MTEKSSSLAIVGPTAVGKTATAILVAKEIGGEIVSCDSMQIYREMSVGTAKPTAEERATVPHHLVDFLSPFASYSAADYARDARQAAEEIFSRGRVPVFAGGTGLYLEAARTDRHKELPSDPETMDSLRARLTSGEESEEEKLRLHKELTLVDPLEAEKVHYRNLRRVLRALLIYHATGIPKSEWDRRSKDLPPALPMQTFLIDVHDRALLYARIEARVDRMIENGLVEETQRLYEGGVFRENTTAAQAIGYKELIDFIEGRATLAEAVETLKTASRRYAKRQLTWFHAVPDIIPVYADEGGTFRTPEAIAADIINHLKSKQ